MNDRPARVGQKWRIAKGTVREPRLFFAYIAVVAAGAELITGQGLAFRGEDYIPTTLTLEDNDLIFL